MKVERWKEETDEEWAERLSDETMLANNTEVSQYFIERDPYAEDSIIINYIGETGWTWKEHPEGPFSCKQILEWKQKAEAFNMLQMDLHHLEKYGKEYENKLRAIRKIQEELEEWRSLGFEESHAKADPHDVLIGVDDELTKILEGV